MPLKVEIEEYEKGEEKTGKYVRILYDEGAGGIYEDKLRTHTFVEANTQAKWDEFEQLMKDPEMKVAISVKRSRGRENDWWNAEYYVLKRETKMEKPNDSKRKIPQYQRNM